MPIPTLPTPSLPTPTPSTPSTPSTPTPVTEEAATTPVDPADLLGRAAAGHADAWAAIVARNTPCCAAASAATACRTPTRTT